MESYHLDPAFFPQSTRDALPLALIRELGALPLGYKESSFFFKPCKRLNIGVTDARRANVRRVKKALKEILRASEYRRLQIYAVERDAFARVLTEVYGVQN